MSDRNRPPAAELKSLSDQLQVAIAKRIETRIELAISAARAVALQAYGDAFRQSCGRTVHLIVCDALDEAERKIVEAARAQAMQREVEAAVLRLTQEQKVV